MWQMKREGRNYSVRSQILKRIGGKLKDLEKTASAVSTSKKGRWQREGSRSRRRKC